MSVSVPPIVTRPFGFDADPAFITVPIPVSPPGDPRASYELGFPPVTFSPEVSGGLPPDGRDFNGILNTVTAHCAYINAGQPYVFDTAVPAALTGYGVGAQLGMADGSGFWFNLTANNAANPDTSTISANGWTAGYAYGFTTISALTGGTVTLTNLQHRRGTIVLSGTLTSNLQLVFPTLLREWRIVNQCVGAFTVTVKTAAGTGVVVPSGSFANPVSVYGDGTNLYPTVAPLMLPLAVAPNPDTIVQRSSAADIFARYFNSNTALETPTVGSVFVQNSGADGFLRKIGITNFEAQLLLQNMGGVLINGQVPIGVVSQHAAALFTNAALTGVPTAPTAAPGASDTQIATTAFANPGQSQAQTGFVKLPGGLIIQWGYSQGAAGPGTIPVVFPIAFTSTAFIGLCSNANRTAAGSNGYGHVSGLSVVGMTIAVDAQTNGLRGGYWLAVGV
jgi:hypothetical protein